MCHALIIDDNMIVSRTLEDRLVPLGFDSFDHAWTEEDAVAAATQRMPDLIVVGDTIECGSAIDAARRISMKRDIPILMVTADSFRARERLPRSASCAGPFLLSEIDTAVEQARHQADNLQETCR